MAHFNEKKDPISVTLSCLIKIMDLNLTRNQNPTYFSRLTSENSTLFDLNSTFIWWTWKMFPTVKFMNPYPSDFTFYDLIFYVPSLCLTITMFLCDDILKTSYRYDSYHMTQFSKKSKIFSLVNSSVNYRSLLRST